MDDKTKAIECALRELGNRHAVPWRTISHRITGVSLLASDLGCSSPDIVNIHDAVFSLWLEDDLRRI